MTLPKIEGNGIGSGYYWKLNQSGTQYEAGSKITIDSKLNGNILYATK